MIVIGPAMLLEIEAQIQKRFLQGAFGAQKERDEQSSQPAIAV